MLEILFNCLRYNLRKEFNKTIHISTANSFVRPCFYLEIGKQANRVLCAGLNQNTITFSVRFFATEDQYSQPDRFEIMQTIDRLNKTLYRVIKYNHNGKYYYFNIVSKDYEYDGNGDLILNITLDYTDLLNGGIIDETIEQLVDVVVNNKNIN